MIPSMSHGNNQKTPLGRVCGKAQSKSRFKEGEESDRSHNQQQNDLKQSMKTTYIIKYRLETKS